MLSNAGLMTLKCYQMLSNAGLMTLKYRQMLSNAGLMTFKCYHMLSNAGLMKLNVIECWFDHIIVKNVIEPALNVIKCDQI